MTAFSFMTPNLGGGQSCMVEVLQLLNTKALLERKMCLPSLEFASGSLLAGWGPNVSEFVTGLHGLFQADLCFLFFPLIFVLYAHAPSSPNKCHLHSDSWTSDPLISPNSNTLPSLYNLQIFYSVPQPSFPPQPTLVTNTQEALPFSYPLTK